MTRSEDLRNMLMGEALETYAILTRPVRRCSLLAQTACAIHAACFRLVVFLE